MTQGRPEGVAVGLDHRIKTFILEDNDPDARAMAGRLEDAGIFDVTVCPTLGEDFENEYIEKAIEASIISLDLDVDKSHTKSIRLARDLQRLNPYRAIFYCTLHPEQVENKYLNFIVDKRGRVLGKEFFKEFHRISLQILSHDVCLAILQKLQLVFPASNKYEKEVRDMAAAEIRDGAKRFLTDLKTIKYFVRNYHSGPVQRYEGLEKTLNGILGGSSKFVFEESIDIQRSMLETVIVEQDILENDFKIKLRKDLKLETDNLRKAILSGKSFHILDATGKPIGDSDANRVIEYDQPGEVEADKDVASQEDASLKTQSPEKVAEEPATYYLNVWFEAYSDEEKSLIINKPATLFIHIGEPRGKATPRTSSRISGSGQSLFEDIEYVDALVLCPAADIEPLSSRLFMPPGPTAKAEFKVTPRVSGKHDLTVKLLYLNDPVYIACYSFNVLESN